MRNHGKATHEQSVERMIIPRRLFALLSLLLAVMLPLEAANATSGCLSMAVPMPSMDDGKGCAGNEAPEQAQCLSLCIVPCQSIPPADGVDGRVLCGSAIDRPPFTSAFRLLSESGPEPPPPRLMR